MQTTVVRQIAFTGVGVHGGQKARAVIKPAPADFGVGFRRVDIQDRDNFIPAKFDNVVDTRLCTILANSEGVTVSTVEHLMAALAGMGVHNALIEIDGPEIPIMDGSSAAFVRGLKLYGLRNLPAPSRILRVLEHVEVVKDNKIAALSPCDRFEIDFVINFADAAIGRQARSVTLRPGVFAKELSNARTFGRLQDAERLRAAGLGKGASLETAVVVDGARVLNEGGLRYKDEFVRHKILDAVGDLALAGGPILGRYTGERAGHEMTNLLLRELFSRPSAYAWEMSNMHLWRRISRRAKRSLGLDLAVG